MARGKVLKDCAVLSGFDGDGARVFEETLTLDVYWDGSHAAIDNVAFRVRLNIRKLNGRLYGSNGQLLQEFANDYDAHGILVASHARHEDGTERTFPR